MFSSMEVRRQVLEAAREISSSGMVIGTWGNVSARATETEGFVITPSGMDYAVLTPEDMVVVDYNRQVIEGKFRPSSETPLHLAIYLARPDVQAIVHVHSPFATAFAVAGIPIPVILEETAQAIGHEIAVVPYARTGTRKLAEYTVKTLGEKGCAALLSNHGVIGVGGSMAQALRICYVIEQTAQVGLYARMLGPLQGLPEDEVNLLHAGFQKYGQKK
ncbi:MAG TPA: class II aldolase [Syntrophomonas sp.]|jgi:L-fuculose-phosphate aldolase|nr:class II aldolase [Syntrophomonas sp.]